jgi:multifunctional 2-oxoglutarate metabolism enzyme
MTTSHRMPPIDPASDPLRPALNAWLVAEMEDLLHDDPSAVSADWQAHLRASGNGGSGNGATHTNGNGSSAGRGLPPAVAAIDPDGPEPRRLRGTGARIVENMEHSLAVPTATSVREVPAKLLEVNRRIINNYLKRIDGGKVSFTHLIAYAMVRALDEVPAMMRRYTEVDGKPAVIDGGPVGLGLAVDVPASDGGRSLLVPVIADAASLDFAGFLSAYEAVVRRIRANDLDPAMFAG